MAPAGPQSALARPCRTAGAWLLRSLWHGQLVWAHASPGLQRAALPAHVFSAPRSTDVDRPRHRVPGPVLVGPPGGVALWSGAVEWRCGVALWSGAVASGFGGPS